MNDNTRSLVCPSCGGHMELSENKDRLSCPYCGHELLIEKKNYKQMEYDRLMGRAKAEEELRKREEKRKNLPRRKALLILIAFFAFGFLFSVLSPTGSLHELFFPVEADPFPALRVSFYGEDGSGRVKVESSDVSGLPRIRFSAEPEKDLRNGDRIRVRAESELGYRWTPAEKVFVVSGLVAYIHAMDELVDEDWTRLRENTRRLIEEDWAELLKRGEVVSVEAKPYRDYLFIQELPREENVLYVSFETTVTRANGTTLTVYQTCDYRSLKRQADGSLSASYGSLESFQLGYYYGFSPSSSFQGWLDAGEMEADLRAARDGFTLVS